MLISADDVIGPGVALDKMANFLQHRAVEVNNISAQTVRAPDLLNRGCRNYKAVFGDGKHDDLFSWASVSRDLT